MNASLTAITTLIRQGAVDDEFDAIYAELRQRSDYLNVVAAQTLREDDVVVAEDDVRPRHRARKRGVVLGPAKKAGCVSVVFDDRPDQTWTFHAAHLRKIGSRRLEAVTA